MTEFGASRLHPNLERSRGRPEGRRSRQEAAKSRRLDGAGGAPEAVLDPKSRTCSASQKGKPGPCGGSLYPQLRVRWSVVYGSHNNTMKQNDTMKAQIFPTVREIGGQPPILCLYDINYYKTNILTSR